MRIRLGQGTRDWLIELANITLGVLIALGFGELVSDWNAGRDVARARASLVFETSKNIGQSIGRERASTCVERRLDQLATIVERADAAGALPAVGDIASPPIAAWPTAAWDSVGSETRANMTRDELVPRANAALFAGLIARANQRESDLWLQLYTLVGPGRRFAEAEAVGLRRSIGEARAMNRTMLNLTRQYRAINSGMRAAVIAAEVRRYADRINPNMPICRPIARQVPDAYGAAPFADALRPRP